MEEVIIESNAEWHSTNNKFGSPTWLTSHTRTLIAPSRNNSRTSVNQDEHETSKGICINSQSSIDRFASRGEIVIIDSEDEEESVLCRELTTANSGDHLPKTSKGDIVKYVGHRGKTLAMQSRVIDLTEESDAEDSQASSKKRRIEAESTGIALKRDRSSYSNGSNENISNYNATNVCIYCKSYGVFD